MHLAMLALVSCALAELAAAQGSVNYSAFPQSESHRMHTRTDDSRFANVKFGFGVESKTLCFVVFTPAEYGASSNCHNETGIRESIAVTSPIALLRTNLNSTCHLN